MGSGGCRSRLARSRKFSESCHRRK